MITLDQYTAYLVMQGLAENSIRCYRACFARWRDWAISHDRDPYRPDPLAVRAWASQISGTRSVIAHARATISHLCNALEIDNVANAIPLPRQPKPASRALEHERAVKLASYAADAGMHGTAVLVGLYTGARRSEIANLAWGNVKFEANTIRLVRPKTRDTHDVWLHPHLAEHLYDRWVPGEQWVFPGRHGGHVAPATVWQWIVELAERAGMGHITPHQLRHTLLTEINDTTSDLRAAQDVAGHTNPQVTAGYTRVHRDAARRAIESISFRPDERGTGTGA